MTSELKAMTVLAIIGLCITFPTLRRMAIRMRELGVSRTVTAVIISIFTAITIAACFSGPLFMK